MSGSSLDALIDIAEGALEQRRSQALGDLKKELAEVVERRKRLEAFQDIQETIEARQSAIQERQSQLNDTMKGMTLDELQNSVNKTRAAADTEALTRRIVEGARDLLRRDEENSVSCPVCEALHSRQDLESILQQTIDKLSDATTSTLDRLEAQFERAENLEREVQNLRNDLAGLKQEADTAKARIDPDDTKELLETIKRYLAREASIQDQLGGREDGLDKIGRQLSNLKEEERFHDIRKRITSIKQSRDRFERVEEAYSALVKTFGKSVRSIRKAVEICLKERLENDIPRVSESLSKVFASLTHHPWYDRLTIVKDKLPELELRVASSHDSSGREYPTAVLNGQAESALALVPHFAFSQADDTPTEVYLVLLDDPTRAFDEEHTKILVKRLAELGNHVQLVVASQETGRFRELLPENFQSSGYVVVEPGGWTYSDGPRLKIERYEPCKT